MEAFTGASGWTGAGLLGLVLAWLFFKYLPAKDKQIAVLLHSNQVRYDALLDLKMKEMRDQRESFIAGISSTTNNFRTDLSEHRQSLLKMADTFRSEAKEERQACEKHFETLSNSIGVAFKTIGDQLASHSQRNQQWMEILKKRIDEEVSSRDRSESGCDGR